MNNLNQITSKANELLSLIDSQLKQTFSTLKLDDEDLDHTDDLETSSELIEQFGGLQNLCNYSNLQELSTKIEYALRQLKPNL